MAMMTGQQTWQATLEQLQHQMTKATFNTWVKNARLVKCENDTYTIGVKNDYAKDWLENRLKGTIKRTLSNTAGCPVLIDFIVLPPQHSAETPHLFMAAEQEQTNPGANGRAVGR
ncbi:MAG: DnaA N-terminal domain-containing protein, partial [Anaerolineae bacterium]